MDNHQVKQPPHPKSRIIAALQRLFFRRIPKPDQPYMPQPGEIMAPPAMPPTAPHYESESDVRQIYGSSIPFGTQKALIINENGHVQETSRTPSYIVGSGRRVSSIDEIGGVCRYCQTQAAEAFQEGKLSHEQMQLQSFFDVDSECRCSVCSQYFCGSHCRPVETSDGLVETVCVDCTKQLKRDQRRRRITSFLLSPFEANEEDESTSC